MLISSPDLKTSLDSFTKSLAATNMIPMGITAEFILFTEADFPFEIFIPGVTSGYIAATLGIEYRCTPGFAFTEVQIRNPSGTTATQTVEGFFGFGRIEDRRLNVVGTRANQAVRFSESPSTVWEQIQAVTTPLAAGQASGAQSGAATTARGRRKFCIINNLDATNPLWLVKGASYPADYLLYVPALTAMRVDTDATFYVHNPNGTAISYVLAHCFYTSPQV